MPILNVQMNAEIAFAIYQAPIWGTDGSDSLHGTTGADTMYGGAGNDSSTAAKGGLPRWRCRCRQGILFDSAAGVHVDLANNLAWGGDAEGDTLVSIENLLASQYNDVLIGNSADNSLNGMTATMSSTAGPAGTFSSAGPATTPYSAATATTS